MFGSMRHQKKIPFPPLKQAVPHAHSDYLNLLIHSLMPAPITPADATFPMRLNRYLAKQGIATRREADALIEAGRIIVNGKKATLGMKVSETDQVTVENANRRHHTYLAYYKPRGIITHSPQGKREYSIADVTKKSDLFPIGRLDKDSEGLIILTNDGRITERLLHPRFAHEKEYEVTVQETIDKSKLPALEAGIMEEGELLTAKSVRVTGKDTLTIVLTEGKKHQVRRMLSAIHLTVIALKRVRIMNVFIGSLNPGQSRPISGAAREAFLADLGLQ